LGEIGQFHIIKLIAKGSGCWRIEFSCTIKIIDDYLYLNNIEFNKIIQGLKQKINVLASQRNNNIGKLLFIEINNFKKAETCYEFKKMPYWLLIYKKNLKNNKWC